MEGEDITYNELNLYNAAERGDVEYVKKALAKKIDPNWWNPDCCQYTALHQASCNNHSAVVKALVDAGANIDLQDENGQTPIYLASHSGSIDAVITLLDSGANIEIATYKGMTPIMTACPIEVMRALIDAHANIKKIDDFDQTALHWATCYNYSETVQLLLQKGLDLRQLDSKGMSPVDYAKKLGYHELVTIMLGDDVVITELDLFNAAERGDLEYVDKALASKIDPNWQNPQLDHRTALHQAAQYNRSAVMSSLFVSGANRNLQDEDGKTPIYVATCYGHIDAVTTLIDCGADVNIAADGGRTPIMITEVVEIMQALIDAKANLSQTDDSGQTALHWAASLDYSEVIPLLLQKGLDPKKQDKKGKTPVDLAKEWGHYELVNMMVGDDFELTEMDLFDAAFRGYMKYVDKALANKINPSWQNPDDQHMTALHKASFNNHSAVVRSLVAAGANKDLKDDNGETPIFVASGYDHIDVVNILIDCGADINMAADGGVTPIMTTGSVEVAKALIDAHANLKSVDDSGWTALHHAAWGNNKEILQLLLQKGLDPRKQDKEGKTPVDNAKDRGYSKLVTIMVGDDVEKN